MSKKENVSKAKKIYNVVSTIVIAIVFVFLIVIVSVMLWQRKSGGDSSLFGYYMFEVVTDSMSGYIEPGEVILAKKVENVNALKEGDIITFIAPSGDLKGNNVTHRIVEVERDENGNVMWFRTKGDNPNVGIDNWQLKPEQVKAVYIRKSTFITGLREFLSHWYGYVLIIALPLTLVGVLIIVGYVRDRVEAERKKQNAVDASVIDNLSEEERQKLIDDIRKSQNGFPNDNEEKPLENSVENSEENNPDSGIS